MQGSLNRFSSIGFAADLIHEASFWKQMPNLLTLGAPLIDVGRVSAPPAGHPLRRLRILSLYPDKRYLVRCHGLRRTFPGIRLFTLLRQETQ